METFNSPEIDETQQNRWYIGGRVNWRKDPHDLVRQIFELIPRYDLRNFLTRICYERGAANKQEFYIFLGVTSVSKGFIPIKYQKGFDTLLRQFRLRDTVHLTYEDFEHMASDEIEGQNFQQIRMPNTGSVIQVSDPFSITDFNYSNASYSFEGFNRLLQWMSAVGSASWDLYNSTVESLGITENRSDASRIIRHLQALGYVEMFDHGRKWIMCHSCIVIIKKTSDGIVCYLTGKRSEFFVDMLTKTMATVEIITQSQRLAPDRICASFPSEAILQDAVKMLERQGLGPIEIIEDASLRLALALPRIRDWLDNLIQLPGLVRSSYDYRIWKQDQKTFVSIEKIPDETGFYELSRVTDAEYAPVFNAFYDEVRDKWFRGDWYGLRFLSLVSQKDLHPVAYYAVDERKIIVHRDERWPSIYERALTLASGLLPYKSNDDLLHFDNVSIDVAHILTDKLNVELIQK